MNEPSKLIAEICYEILTSESKNVNNDVAEIISDLMEVFEEQGIEMDGDAAFLLSELGRAANFDKCCENDISILSGINWRNRKISEIGKKIEKGECDTGIDIHSYISNWIEEIAECKPISDLVPLIPREKEFNYTDYPQMVPINPNNKYEA